MYMKPFDALQKTMKSCQLSSFLLLKDSSFKHTSLQQLRNSTGQQCTVAISAVCVLSCTHVYKFHSTVGDNKSFLKL